MRPIPEKYRLWCHSWNGLQELLKFDSHGTFGSLYAFYSLTAHGFWREASALNDCCAHLWDSIPLDLAPRRSEKLIDYWKTLDGLDRYLKSEPLLKSLLSEEHVFAKSRIPSKKVIAVFGTGFNNFGVSFGALHAILQRYDANVIYLKSRTIDFSYTSSGLGRSPEEIANSLLKMCHSRGLELALVMGFSSSFYMSIRVAGLIQVKSYIGFGPITHFETSRINNLKRRPEIAKFYEDAAGRGLPNLTSCDEVSQIGSVTVVAGSERKDDVVNSLELQKAFGNLVYKEFSGAPHNVVWEAIYTEWLDATLTSEL